MIRRTFLKGSLMFLGTCAFSLLDGLKSAKSLFAGQLPPVTRAQPQAPITTVRQAIQTNSSKEVVSFVMSQSMLAQSSSPQEKLDLLKLIVFDCQRPGTALEQKNREQAAYLILKNEEGNHATLAQLADGIGRPWLQKSINSWSNADLKRIVAKGIAK